MGVGKINKHGPQSLQLEVTSRKDLKVLIKFFKKHKLISQKQGDFELWCEVLERIVSGPTFKSGLKPAGPGREPEKKFELPNFY